VGGARRRGESGNAGARLVEGRERVELASLLTDAADVRRSLVLRMDDSKVALRTKNSTKLSDGTPRPVRVRSAASRKSCCEKTFRVLETSLYADREPRWRPNRLAVESQRRQALELVLVRN